MISLDYRTHVIAWKMQRHIMPGRVLTADEWRSVSSLPKVERFQHGEEIEPNRVVWSYLKTVRNGLNLVTCKAFAHATAEAKKRAAANRETKNAKSREYYKRNREAILQRTTDYQSKNRARTRQRQKKWVNENREIVRAYHRAARLRYQQIPAKRVKKLLRLSIRCRTKQRLLYGRVHDDPSVDFLVWLAERMRIDPLQGYEIDHLIPLSTWDLSTTEQQVLANAPENVRWLTAKENQVKSDHLPSETEIRSHLALVGEWKSSRAAEVAA